MEGEMKFLNRKLIIDKCGFKNFISTAQFLDLNKIDRFLMTDLGLTIPFSYTQPLPISDSV